AVVMSAGEEPLFAGFAWLQPGEHLAGKLFEVIAKLVEESDNEQVARVDLTLADHEVMQLQFRSVETEYDDDYDLSDDYSDLSEEEQKTALIDAQNKWVESAVEKEVFQTVWVARLGGRLLMVHTYQSEEEATASATAERLSAILGQWLADHESGSSGFVARLSEEPGTARVMALEGLPTVELLGDAAPLVKMLKAAADSEMAEKALRIFGLENLGPFAMRSTVQGTNWPTEVSIAIPAPRVGLMQLLDQEAIELDPPQWVPASAVRYYQWSFDLGKAYEIIKEAVLREFPEQAESSFAIAETSVQNFASAPLTEVLSSLGNRHIMMSFGIENATESVDEDNETFASAMERMAFVWQLEDEELWARLMKAITPFAAMAPGSEFTEEQGYSGWRIKSEAMEGGLFHGKGYLVLGYGTGVVESVLASLNNPPTGDDALRGSKIYATASSMIDLAPGLGVEVTDGDRYVSMTFGWMDSQFRQLETVMDQLSDGGDENGEDDQQLFLSLARAILPNRDEIEGMIGVITSRWEINDDGVFGSSWQEMPAP
ncbi:MAG: hypothetical protein ACR2NM_02955, partial [Bythopirellula sp.]